MKVRSLSAVGLYTAAVAATVCSHRAQAQDTAVIDEIVVSARKRSESIQGAPVPGFGADAWEIGLFARRTWPRGRRSRIDQSGGLQRHPAALVRNLHRLRLLTDIS
jgi:hypothetical protein